MGLNYHFFKGGENREKNCCLLFYTSVKHAKVYHKRLPGLRPHYGKGGGENKFADIIKRLMKGKSININDNNLCYAVSMITDFINF